MKRIGVFADTHCGHKNGLTPPGFWGGGPGYAEKQEDRWDWFVKSIKEQGPFDGAIFPGDLTDGPGVKSGNETVIKLNFQADAAVEIIRTVGAKKNFLTYGTPVHTITGDGYEIEKAIAKEIGAEIHGQIWLEVEGFILDIRHHPAGSSQVYPGNPLQKERESNLRWSLEKVQPLAQIILRGHVHKSFQIGEPGVWQAISIPALQDFGSIYGRRLSNLVHMGYGIMDIEKGVWPVWKTYMAPRNLEKVCTL